MSLTTDPTTPCLREIRADGQQECYLVLSDEERTKGFVRPVRQVYRHVKCGCETRMGLAIAETYARNPSFYNGTFCVHCGTHFQLVIAQEMENPDHPDGLIRWTQHVRQFEWIVNGRHDGSFVGE